MGQYEETFRERRIKMERIKKQIIEWYDAHQIEIITIEIIDASYKINQ